MKRILIRLVIVVVVLAVLAIVAVSLFLDGAIKKGVETIGPQLTRTEIKLDGVGLSILSGKGELRGFVVGNPEGFKTPSALRLGSVNLAVAPRSFLSDKAIVHSIKVEGPEITFEGTLKGNNLGRLLENVEAATGGGKAAPAAESSGAQRKLQVDEFLLTGGRINLSTTLLGGKAASIALPTIHLTQLGSGPDGITVAELSKRVLGEITKHALEAVGAAMKDLGKGATDAVKEAGKGSIEDATRATKGITDLLKKKKE